MPIPTGNIKQTTEQSSVEFGKDVLHTLIWESCASIWHLFYGTGKKLTWIRNPGCTLIYPGKEKQTNKTKV